jgi:hypothetical protein
MDHLLLPLHSLLDRFIIWPLVITQWFAPATQRQGPRNPHTLNTYTYSSLLHHLLSFFHRHYPLPDGRHALSLSEDEFDTFMEQRRGTHRLIPFDLRWIGKFVSFYPPITHFVTVLAIAPLLRWFVGPIVPHIHRDERDGATSSVSALIPSCRFLSEARDQFGDAKGSEMCVKLCAISMEHIMRERASVDVHLLPDLEHGSCIIHVSRRPVDENGKKTRYLSCASLDW